MAETNSLYHTKNRIVAIDIVRIIAAFAVMVEHTIEYGGNHIVKFLSSFPTILSPLSPLFFVLAGYFVSRNITWKKALNNSWWCFAPFILWNTVTIALFGALYGLPENSNAAVLFGIRRVFALNWDFFPQAESFGFPLNYPLWFMRDLIFLFLLSPILSRWSRIVFPVLVIASIIPEFTPCFTDYSNWCLLSPRSMACFSAGCLLQSFSKDMQRAMLTFYSPLFIVGFITLMGIDALYFHFMSNAPQLHLLKELLGLWTFYQIARWIEVKIPLATPFALKFAPVTFLTFATHCIFFRVFQSLSWRINPTLLTDSAFPLLYTPVVALAMAVFFFALKRYCPSLLHLVAHYKLRPDDIKPAPQQ